jgi:hypothetical protein
VGCRTPPVPVLISERRRRWACLNGLSTTGAVEAEGEEDVVSGQSLEPGVKVALGHREGVAEMQGAVHVGEGEGLEVFGLVGGLDCEKLVTVPDSLGSLLEGDQLVTTGCVLHLPIY